MVNFETETDLSILRQAGQLLDAENKRLHERLRAMCRDVATLRGDDAKALQLELLRLEELAAQRAQKLFGDSSERRSKPERTRRDANKPRPGHGPTEQPELGIEPVEHDLDEADKMCPKCGRELREMGQSEDSDEVDIVERKLVIRRHKRKKYRCRCNGHVETAPGPGKLIPGGRYSIDFAVHVAVDKFSDHIPWERQVRRFARDGLRVTTATLYDQCFALAMHLKPLRDKLLAYVTSLAVLGADETWWRLLADKPVGKTSKKWWAWVLSAEDAVYYDIRQQRSSEVVIDLLEDFEGFLVVDGFGAYKKALKTGARYTLCFCWSHGRRKFMEAEANYPREAGAILDLIDHLFRIEREAATGPPEGLLERRAAMREERSQPVLDALEVWSKELRVLPKSSLGRAMRYMMEHWKGLTRFVDNPIVPIHNNASENSARGPVLGRRNFGGNKSSRGMEVTEILYSLIESAKLAGVDPRAYLKAMAHAAVGGDELVLPHEYAAALKAANESTNDE